MNKPRWRNLSKRPQTKYDVIMSGWTIFLVFNAVQQNLKLWLFNHFFVTILTAFIKQQQWLQGILQTSPTESCPQNFAVNGKCHCLDVLRTRDFPCSRASFPVTPRPGTPARWETTVCPWGYSTSCSGLTAYTSPRKHGGGSGREKPLTWRIL